MAQDQRVDMKYLSGAGYAKGQSPVFDGRVFKPGGGALLGYCDVTVGGFGTITSNGSSVDATTLSLDSSYGSHGVVVDDVADEITYNADNIPSYYLVTGGTYLIPSTNVVSTDVTDTIYTDPMLHARAVFVGVTLGQTLPWAVGYVFTSSTTGTPNLKIRCSGGTNRQYTSGFVGLSIARFAAPS